MARRRFRPERKKFLSFDREHDLYGQTSEPMYYVVILQYIGIRVYCTIGLCQGRLGTYFFRGLLCFIIIRSTWQELQWTECNGGYVTRIPDDQNGFLHDCTSYYNNKVSERNVPKNQIVNRCRNRFRYNNL